MRKSNRLPDGRAADGELAGLSAPARKKSHSVLIQRAVLFTAAEFLVAVLAGSPAFHLAEALGAGRWASLIGLMTGFVAACLAGWPLSGCLLAKSVKQISDLRDVAVNVAGGDFDAHADESAPDEVGELGRALNNLSYQLSRNMYMLIVERNRLKNMLNGLSEGIIAIDSSGAITHVNPAIESMFEQKKISLGLPDARMKHVPDLSVWEDFDAVIRSGEAVTRNFNSRDSVIRLTITPIVDEIGTIAGAVGLFSDITQSERLERTRREYRCV